MDKKASFRARFFLLEENDKWRGVFCKKMTTALPQLSRIFAAEKQKKTMPLSEKQKAAHKLAADYMGLLDQQEAMVERVFDRKWKEIEPWLEQLIDKKIAEHLAS